MTKFQEYLKIFDLAEPFSAKELKAAYFAKAHIHHPDHCSPEDRHAAGQEFARLQEAYLFLKNLLDEKKKTEEAFLQYKATMAAVREGMPDGIPGLRTECEEGNNLGLLFRLFALDGSAYSLLVSILADLCAADIEDVYQPIWEFPGEHGEFLEEEKGRELWHFAWEQGVRKVFQARPFRPRPAIWNDRSREFQDALKKLRLASTPFLRELIALELAGCDLYWKIPEMPPQSFYGFSPVREALRAFFDRIFRPADLSGDFVVGLREALENAMHQIHPGWKDLLLDLPQGGKGTLFGATLSAPRTFSLTPEGILPRNGCATPEMVAIAGSGLRLWVKEEPRFVAIGGGAALISPLCGDERVFLGQWSLPEVLLSLAKLQVFMQVILPRNPKYGFCQARLVDLLSRLPAFLEKIQFRVDPEARGKIETVRGWAWSAASRPHLQHADS